MMTKLIGSSQQFFRFLFPLSLFGFVWGLTEVIIILIQGRAFPLADKLIIRISIMILIIFNKVFISFVLAMAGWVILRLLKVAHLFAIIIFCSYIFLYYSLRILIPHGYIVNLKTGLIAVTICIPMIISLQFFSSLVSEKVIKLTGLTLLSMTLCILILAVVVNIKHHYHLLYFPGKESSYENLAKDIKPKYNILFIIVDALRKDHLHCYGYKRENTPFMDEFSRHCIIFDNYRSVSTETTTSTASLFTGQYPANHEAFSYQRVLKDDNFTIAEYFKALGYKTALISANVLISKEFNFNQGFDYYQSNNSAPASWLYNEFTRILPELKNSRFFIYLHFMETHTPYLVEERFVAPFVADSFAQQMKAKFGLNQSSNYGGFTRHPAPETQYTTQGEFVALYDGAILQFDYYLQKIVEVLKEQGLDENTIIVVSSDHGEFMGEWGLFCTHGAVPYCAQVDVPLMIKYNDIHLRFPEVMENRNIFRLIVDILHHEPRNSREIENVLKKFSSKFSLSQRGNFSPFIQAISYADRDIKYIFNYSGIDAINIFTLPDLLWPWKVRELIIAENYYNYLYKHQLYKLPDETNFYFVFSLKNKYLKLLKEKITIKESKHSSSKKREVSKELKKKLKSLGYIR